MTTKKLKHVSLLVVAILLGGVFTFEKWKLQIL